MQQIVDFILELERLKGVERRARPLGLERYENPAEHSWQIALLAWSLVPYAGAEIDIHRVVGMLLVVMGLSIILRDQTRHVFISAGLCLAMCAVFFAVVFGGKFLGTGDYVSPALAAWLPVLIFGPLSVALYDAIHT